VQSILFHIDLADPLASKNPPPYPSEWQAIRSLVPATPTGLVADWSQSWPLLLSLSEKKPMCNCGL